MGRIVLLFSLVVSLICALAVIPAAGQFASNYPYSVLLIPLFLSGGIFFKTHRQAFLLMGFLSVIVFATMYAYLCNKVHFSLNTSINAIEGYMVQDSSISENGNLVLRVFLSGCEDTGGNSATARGSITAVAKENVLVCAGSRVRLEGSFSNEIFICSQVAVREKDPLEYLRSNLILLFEKRLAGCPLGEMLILGRADSDNGETGLKNLARSCGCIHVLALSGMHLNVIGGTVYKVLYRITGKKRTARLVSFIPTTAFVFVAGPRPSLVRAYLMSVLFFLEPEERVAMAFFIQLAFLPWSIFNTGSAYGYISVIAIFVLFPCMEGALGSFLPSHLASALGLSVSVTAFIAPLQMLLDGHWYPAALFIGPPAALLITLQMSLALVSLAFPGLEFVRLIAEKSAAFLERIFTLGSKVPSSGLLGYLILAASCLLMLFLVRLSRHRLKDRFRI